MRKNALCLIRRSRRKQLPAYKRFVELESEMLSDVTGGDSGFKASKARTAMVDVY